MSLYQKYDLLKLLDNGEIQSFQAREIATGRLVYVHWLSGIEGARRAELLGRLRTSAPGKILEIDDSLTPYAVTEVIEPFQGLMTWLGGAPAPVPPAPGPGEFSRIFGLPSAAEPPKAPPAAPPAVAMKAAPPVQEPGEFTRMFLSPPGSSAPDPVLANPPAPKPADGPGEFTRLFMAPGAPPAAPAAPAAAGPSSPAHPSEPGDFTRFFQSPVASNPIPIEEIERGSLAPPPPPPREAPFQGPGDFTQRFGVSELPGAPSAAPAPLAQAHPYGGGDASGLFRSAQPVSVAPPPGSAPSGPSDFTRIMKAPKAPVATPGATAPAVKHGLPMPVIILLCALIVGCLLVAGYFLLRK